MIFLKADDWFGGVEIVDAYVLDVEEDLACGVQAGLDEIFNEFVLRVDGDPGCAEVDAVAAAGEV